VRSCTNTFIASAIFIALAFALSFFFQTTLEPNVWIIFLFPIIEEYVFRSQLQSSLKPINSSLLWGTLSNANLVTSLLFSITHSLLRGWEVGLAVFIPSIFLGWLYEREKSLLLNIFVHCVANSAFCAKNWIY